MKDSGGAEDLRVPNRPVSSTIKELRRDLFGFKNFEVKFTVEEVMSLLSLRREFDPRGSVTRNFIIEPTNLSIERMSRTLIQEDFFR